MKKFFLILVVLFVVVVIVAATFPARLVTSAVLPESSSVQLDDVSGSIWKGSAGRLLYKGVDQGRFSWQVQPASLLRRQIDVVLDLQGTSMKGVARLVREADRVHISDAHVTVPADRLEPLLDIPALHLTGHVQLDLDEMELVNRVPTALKGSATWHEAGVTGEDQASFGTLVANFGALSTGGFGGTVEDQGGPLELDGQFKTTLMGYEAEAILRARNDDPQVTRALRHIGEIQPDGSVLYQVKGGLGR